MNNDFLKNNFKTGAGEGVRTLDFHLGKVKGCGIWWYLAGCKNSFEVLRKERLDKLTFGEHFHDYMERYSKLHKLSWKYEDQINLYVSHWFKSRLSDITKDNVARLHCMKELAVKVVRLGQIQFCEGYLPYSIKLFIGVGMAIQK